MNFTSQICTTEEQSERLLALGLNPETADMYYSENPRLLFIRDKGVPLEEEDFPAWSLHRLIEMYTKHYVCEHINLKMLTYDVIIENIRLDILTGTFNKEYLN